MERLMRKTLAIAVKTGVDMVFVAICAFIGFGALDVSPSYFWSQMGLVFLFAFCFRVCVFLYLPAYVNWIKEEAYERGYEEGKNS